MWRLFKAEHFGLENKTKKKKSTDFGVELIYFSIETVPEQHVFYIEVFLHKWINRMKYGRWNQYNSYGCICRSKAERIQPKNIGIFNGQNSLSLSLKCGIHSFIETILSAVHFKPPTFWDILSLCRFYKMDFISIHLQVRHTHACMW